MQDATAGRKATLVLLSNVAGAGLGYVALLLIGRYFAPASYGAYLFALSVTGLVAVVSNLGLGIAHQRHVAQGTDASQAFGVLARLRLVVALPVLAVGLLAYLAWSALKGQAVTDATTPLVLGLALTIQVFSAARQTLFDTWQGQQRVHRIELAKIVDTALVVTLLGNAALLVAHLQGRWEVVPGIGGFWAGLLGLEAAPTLREGAALLAGAYLVGKGLSFLLSLVWWLGDGIRLGPWDRGLARSYVRLALPLAVVGSLGMVLQYTDTLMLGILWTSAEVGIYGAAQRLAGLCLLAALAVGTVLFPRFAQLHALGAEEEERKTFAKAERYLFVLVVPVAAAFVALPRESLHIAVGDAYLPAAVPLQLLALWALVGTAEQPMTSRMLGAGQASILVRSSALNAVANVVLNLAFIPTWGLGLGPTGAALATLASTALSYLYIRARSHALHGVPWVAWHQVRTLLAGAIVGVGWWMAAHAMPDLFLRAWQLAAWGLAGGATYLGLLAAFGELHAKDLAFLRLVAHPGHMLAALRGR